MRKLLFLCFLVLLASCKEEDFFSFTESTSDEISFTPAGGSSTLSFSTNTGWKASSDVDWIHLTPSLGNAEQGQITVTADPNPDYDTRNGKISIFAGAIVTHLNIIQEEKKGAVTESSKYEIGQSEQELEIKVQANIDYKVEVLGNALEWITIVSAPDTKALTESKVILKVAENSSFDKRSGIVRIYGGDTDISSEIIQAPSVFFEMAEELTIPYVGDCHDTDISFNIELATNTAFTIKIQEENCEWLTVDEISRIEEPSGGIEKYSVRLVAGKNYEWDRETALIVETGEESHTVVIKQDGIKAILMGLVDSATGISRQALKRTWGTDEPIYNWDGIRIVYTEEYGEGIEIWLNSIDIEGSLPSSFGRLRNLYHLMLAGTYSGTIPVEWGDMRCLTLRLNSPNLTGPIPPELGNIENLEEFSIYGQANINSALPAELGKLKKLRYLRMPDCSITGAIPSTFGDLENLEVLELNDNKLSGGLPSSLGKLKKNPKNRSSRKSAGRTYTGRCFEGGLVEKQYRTHSITGRPHHRTAKTIRTDERHNISGYIWCLPQHSRVG